MELEIIAFPISVPIPIPTPIPMPRFQCRGLQMADKYFPKQNIRINKKDLQRSWVTSGIEKSSKRKHKLHVKHKLH